MTPGVARCLEEEMEGVLSARQKLRPSLSFVVLNSTPNRSSSEQQWLCKSNMQTLLVESVRQSVSERCQWQWQVSWAVEKRRQPHRSTTLTLVYFGLWANSATATKKEERGKETGNCNRREASFLCAFRIKSRRRLCCCCLSQCGLPRSLNLKTYSISVCCDYAKTRARAIWSSSINASLYRYRPAHGQMRPYRACPPGSGPRAIHMIYGLSVVVHCRKALSHTYHCVRHLRRHIRKCK